MTEKAGQAVEQSRGAAADVAREAGAHTQEVKEQVQRGARDLAHEARGHVQGQLADQHRSLVTNLRSLSGELTNMAGGSESGGTATEVVRQAGDRLGGAAGWLESREPGELLDEMRRFARRRPGAFLAGALLAGVAVGRLTRGAIDTHTDDSSASTSSSPSNGSSPMPEPLAGDPFAPAAGPAPELGYSSGPVYGAPPAPPVVTPPYTPPVTPTYPSTSTFPSGGGNER